MANLFVLTNLEEIEKNTVGNIYVEKNLRYEVAGNQIAFFSSLFLTALDSARLPFGGRIAVESPYYTVENALIDQSLASRISMTQGISERLEKAFNIFMRRMKMRGNSCLEGFLEGGDFRQSLKSAAKIRHNFWYIQTEGNERSLVERNDFRPVGGDISGSSGIAGKPETLLDQIIAAADKSAC